MKPSSVGIVDVTPQQIDRFAIIANHRSDLATCVVSFELAQKLVKETSTIWSDGGATWIIANEGKFRMRIHLFLVAPKIDFLPLQGPLAPLTQYSTQPFLEFNIPGEQSTISVRKVQLRQIHPWTVYCSSNAQPRVQGSTVELILTDPRNFLGANWLA